MKVEDLKLFTTVVELGSFTAAANALDLPRANVSRRINDLEKALNLQLFFRTTRSLSLTKSGELYHKELLVALDALANANRAAANLSEKPSGHIKIGLLPETGDILQPLLFHFHDQYPDIELDIRNVSNGMVEMYKQGLDIAIHGGKLDNANLVAKKLLDIQRVLVASPNYIEKFNRPETLDDLGSHKFICYRWPTGDVDNHWQIDQQHVTVNPKIVSDSIGFVKDAVLRERGIGFLPTMLTQEEIESGKLVPLLEHMDYPMDEAWLLYPQRKALTHAAQLLIDYLAQEIPRLYQ
ncbi:LysR family transcriptional regulator [Vibrio maerlii]|uniref:LysR family transcriptional regulator n=1 Tax=Vibrio maerlii TaxID=2231648 RepID=UPI000E3D5B14|nr:LysR family transcriptional regulator [Vibrio maerlii]